MSLWPTGICHSVHHPVTCLLSCPQNPLLQMLALICQQDGYPHCLSGCFCTNSWPSLLSTAPGSPCFVPDRHLMWIPSWDSQRPATSSYNLGLLAVSSYSVELSSRVWLLLGQALIVRLFSARLQAENCSETLYPLKSYTEPPRLSPAPFLIPQPLAILVLELSSMLWAHSTTADHQQNLGFL